MLPPALVPYGGLHDRHIETQLINALRAHLAELGLVSAKGYEGLQQLVMAVTESSNERPG